MFRLTLLLTLLLLPLSSHGDPLTSGSLLAVADQQLFELSSAGQLLQSVRLPGSQEPARDVIVDAFARVQIFHGVTHPILTTWDADENVWMHSGLDGWSTSSEERSPGGITALGKDLIAIDRTTSGTGGPQGLIRFDGEDGYQATRIVQQRDFIDVSVGQDFHLYALRQDQTTLERYDRDALESSATPTPAETITLPSSIQAFAVDARGKIFAATWAGDLLRLSEQGGLELTKASGVTQIVDLDLAQDGRLAVGAKGGKIALTTIQLAKVQVLSLPDVDAVFVAFVEEPREREVMETSFEQGHVGDWNLWIDP